MGLVTNLVVSAGIAGTIALGTMTMWGGSENLENAKNKIVEQAQDLGIFKTNEGKLIDKVGSLKTSIDSLSAQIEQLKASGDASTEQIARLQADLDKATNDLALAQIELDNAQTNGETLAARIDALEAELQKANEDAAALQTVVDSTQTVESDQAAVDAALAEDATATPPDTGGDTETTPTKPADYEDLEIVADGVMYTNSIVELRGNNGNVEYRVKSSSQLSINGGAMQDVGYSMTWTTLGTYADVKGTTFYISDSSVTHKWFFVDNVQ